MIELYNKKLYPTRNINGQEKLASRTTKHYITSKKLYDAKGKALFIIEVTSFKKTRRRTRIEGTTIQKVSVESPNMARNFRRVIEKAKIKAKAGHYSEMGDDMTDFSPGLLEKFVNFRLIDYIIRYERLYSIRLKKPLLSYKSKTVKRRINGRIVKKRYNTVYRFYQVTDRERIETKIEAPTTSNIRSTLEEYGLAPERRGSYYNN